MALSDSDVRHVARLARLGLAPGEAERLRDELARILDHVSSIGELDLADVPPTSHPLDIVNVLAEDEPQPSISREEALRNAPDPTEDGFRVPPIGA
jgi:aspartyl-tRNA(Asn)/glutamyl-tRNA(Gln) amidotransferase subunit C